ncbi:type II toxin-antitoxin system RelE/ParE family toxin [Rhizobium panacihumi]|uniref:type II toxin-antitoxin system RelE/ParE family toxin n=1 Tax=Rhizobium panacihumi TaxID=2008450 RepID=UPI003D791583
MIPIRLSTDAANYVRREAEYLRQHNPAAARNFSLAIRNARQLLQQFPEAGNRHHGLQIVGGRTLVAGDYLLDYLYEGGIIEVISIRHGRMLMQTPDMELDSGLDDD